jgi:geranylgeranyl diphosphate synthase type II
MGFYLESAVQQINKEIETFRFGVQPSNLYDPIKYIMQLGGKRLRPLLVMLSHHLFSDDHKKMIRPAVGVEVFHNFTLLHDDIMDNAPLRRGKPTVHEKWNRNVAILAGDVMMVKAYQLLLDVEEKYYKRILESFNTCAVAVCEGQQLDVDFETLQNIKLDQYLDMISRKTAALLGFSLELGAIAGGADDRNIALLKEFGINIGIAFQLQDDLLDVYGDNKKFGKKTGGDIIAKKKTFLLIKALELAKGKDLAVLESLLTDREVPSDEKVAAVTGVYDNLEIRKITQTAIQMYFEKGISSLSKVQADLYKKNLLKSFVIGLIKRES